MTTLPVVSREQPKTKAYKQFDVVACANSEKAGVALERLGKIQEDLSEGRYTVKWDAEDGQEEIITEVSIDWINKAGFDLVVSVDSVKSILTSEGWEVPTSFDECNAREISEPVRFSIIGDFKKGKTWLMSKLSNNALSGKISSQTHHTPGLCWKYIQIDKVPCLLMDSKGENGPVNSVDPETLNDRRAEELILRDVLCHMADAFVFMVTSLGSHEQSNVQSLVAKLDQKSPNSEVFVVHNVKTISKKHEHDEYLEELGKVLDGTNFRKEQPLIEIHQPVYEKQAIVRFVKGRGKSVPMTHFVLGKEDTAAGELNRFTIKNLQERITQKEKSVRDNESIEAELTSRLKTILPDYLSSRSMEHNLIKENLEIKVGRNRFGVTAIKAEIVLGKVEHSENWQAEFDKKMEEACFKTTRFQNRDKDNKISPGDQRLIVETSEQESKGAEELPIEWVKDEKRKDGFFTGRLKVEPDPKQFPLKIKAYITGETHWHGSDDVIVRGNVPSFVPGSSAMMLQSSGKVPHQITQVERLESDGKRRQCIKLQIKLPGYSLEHLKDDLQPGQQREENKRVLKIYPNAKSIGYTVSVKPQNLKNEVNPEDTMTEDNAFNTQSLHEVLIDVCQRVEATGMSATYEDGMVEILFKKPDRPKIEIRNPFD